MKFITSVYDVYDFFHKAFLGKKNLPYAGKSFSVLYIYTHNRKGVKVSTGCHFGSLQLWWKDMDESMFSYVQNAVFYEES